MQCKWIFVMVVVCLAIISVFDHGRANGEKEDIIWHVPDLTETGNIEEDSLIMIHLV